MDYLVGTNIKLDKFTEKYIINPYVGWLNDGEVNRFLYTGRMPISKDELTTRNDHCNIMFAILCNFDFNKETGQKTDIGGFNRFIGTISINSIDWINRTAEIGYCLGDKNYWGLGLATETVKLVSNYALNRLNLRKIEAGVVDGNTGSIKVLQKNGFLEYGTIPHVFWVDKEYRDMHRFYKMQGW